MGALFYDDETPKQFASPDYFGAVDPLLATAAAVAESLPHFGKLRGKELTEKRANAHVCKIVAAAPNRRPSAGIISLRGMIERLLHEPGEGLRAMFANRVANVISKGWISSAHRDSLHVTSLKRYIVKSLNR